MRAAALLLWIAFSTAGCHDVATPRLVAVLERLEADTLEYVGSIPPSRQNLNGVARLENRMADTLAFAVQGEHAYEFAFAPAPEAPGAFALLFGADTVRVAATVEGSEQKVLVLPPGASEHVRFRVAATAPPPPGAAAGPKDERFWGSSYSESVIAALGNQLPGAELVYLPNPTGRYPFRVSPFEPVITSEQVGGDRWRPYWHREVVRFSRPLPAL